MHPRENDSDFLLQAFSAISDADLDTIKNLSTSNPQALTACDDNGMNMLQMSVISGSYEIFDYLLSLNSFDLNDRNDFGDTALTLALNHNIIFEQFALDLIARGANIHTLCDNKNTLLHLAVRRHQFQIAQALIEKGADINAQNEDACTPLHMLFHMKSNPEGVTEGVGLMLYYGADASICDDNGNTPFELAVIYDPSVTTAQEHLFYYSIDCDSGYKLSSEVLLELLETRSPLFFEVASVATDVVFVKGVFFSASLFFRIETDFLKVMIEKFDYVIKEVFLNPVFWNDYQWSSFQNWEMLLNSHLASDTVEFIGKLKLELVVSRLTEERIPKRQASNFILYLVSHGLHVWEKDLDCIYKEYGYCDLFKTLLHMEIQGSICCDIIPRIIYDVQFDLDQFLDDPHNYSLNALEELLDYFARPRLKSFCFGLNVEKITKKAKKIPQVPLLVEFARDAVRRWLVESLKLTKSKEFYTGLNAIGIAAIHRKIVSFETKLYR